MFSFIKRIPKPTLPPLKLFTVLIPDAIEIAIVSFALNISMAKLFAKRYKYSIRPNQVVTNKNKQTIFFKIL